MPTFEEGTKMLLFERPNGDKAFHVMKMMNQKRDKMQTGIKENYGMQRSLLHAYSCDSATDLSDNVCGSCNNDSRLDLENRKQPSMDKTLKKTR
ncbi:hypothetical protein AVEN_100195-1 [Araneus ventricosus]|uniref:Uncharacterized protein n=1 Tax=Araneus ventricosus TaxID=182803 RepID=A0A4Y2WJC3_ARAVE|nr:hypothetical protein AVEN_100195-1 [Araneus ventricosus]